MEKNSKVADINNIDHKMTGDSNEEKGYFVLIIFIK